jgi:hypothetical protein
MPHLFTSAFTLGVNYPWHLYGEDFGCVRGVHRGISLPDNRDQLLRDFQRIRETGATLVRWFLFADGRGGFVCENGIPRRPDEFLFQDVASTLQLAQQTRLQICFSLIDYQWLQEHAGNRPAYPHEHVLHFAAGREAFLQHVLIPLFREFRAHPALLAWEIVNEPEWAIREFHPARAAKLHISEIRGYAAEIARAIHEFADLPATLGCARLLWHPAWTEIGLDFYQAHFYPSCEKEINGNLARQLAALPQLDKPLYIGELPAKDPFAPEYSLESALTTCCDAGLAGAAVWRWTQPEPAGSDGHIGGVDPALLQSWAAPKLKRSASA